MTHKSKDTSSAQAYKKALMHTVSDESFNAQGIDALTDTLSDDQLESHALNKDIKNILLDTLDFDNFDEKFVDFYPEDDDSSFDRNVITKDANWDPFDQNTPNGVNSDEAQSLLEENYIPGRYKIRHLLGSGASGQVFAINDNNLQRNIAIKFMHPQHITAIDKVQSFVKEAQTTAKLNHPNILPIHDLDFTDGSLPFFSMRQAKGHSLAELIEQSKSDPHPFISNTIKKVNALIKVCDAVSYAHSKGIIHGDIKPGNIMVGDHQNIIVLDWGSSSSTDAQLGRKQKIVGTPMYMAPEQARKEHSDIRSDVYCIGGTLFHLLTLRFPLFHHDPQVFWELKKSGHIDAPTLLETKTIPAPLLSIVIKSLAADPNDRYSSVHALRQDLLHFLNGDIVSAHQDSLLHTLKRFYQKNKSSVLLSLVTLIAVSIIGSLIYLEKLKELSRWQLIHSENFEHYTQQDLAQNWTATYFTNWSFENRHPVDLAKETTWISSQGALQPRTPFPGFNGSNDISPNLPISGDIKFSFDVHTKNAAPYCNVFIGGRDRFQGYTFHVGRWGGERLVTLTKGANMIPLKFGTINFPFEKDSTCTYSIEKTNDTVRLFMQDHLILSYVDPIPLIGAEHEYFGLEGNSNNQTIDNLHVWTKHLPQKVHAITLADSYLNNGHSVLALQAYNALYQDQNESNELRAQALYRSAQCLLNLNRIKEARLRLLQFISQHQSSRHVIDAHMSLANIYIDIQDEKSLLKHLHKIGALYHGDKTTQWLFEKSINFFETSLNISPASFIEADSIPRSLALAERIQELETCAGYQIPEHSSLTKANCAFLLFKLGLMDSLVSHFPTSKYTARYYNSINDLENLVTHFPRGTERVSQLLRSGQYDTYTALHKELASVYGFWSEPRYLEPLIDRLRDYPARLRSVNNRIAKLNHYWVDLNELIRSKQFTAAREKIENDTKMNITWTHPFFLNMSGFEQSVINAPQPEFTALIHAKTIQAIKTWEAGNHKAALQQLHEMHSLRNQFDESAFNSFIITPFFKWLDDKNIEEFTSAIQESQAYIGKRYNNAVQRRLQFITGEIDFESLTAFPENHTPDGKARQFLHCLMGIRQELLGNTLQAIHHYKLLDNPAYNIQHSDAFIFAQSRVRLLQAKQDD